MVQRPPVTSAATMVAPVPATAASCCPRSFSSSESWAIAVDQRRLGIGGDCVIALHLGKALRKPVDDGLGRDFTVRRTPDTVGDEEQSGLGMGTQAILVVIPNASGGRFAVREMIVVPFPPFPTPSAIAVTRVGNDVTRSGVRRG